MEKRSREKEVGAKRSREKKSRSRGQRSRGKFISPREINKSQNPYFIRKMAPQIAISMGFVIGKPHANSQPITAQMRRL